MVDWNSKEVSWRGKQTHRSNNSEDTKPDNDIASINPFRTRIQDTCPVVTASCENCVSALQEHVGENNCTH